MIISEMYLLCSILGVVLHFWRCTDIFAGTRVVPMIARYCKDIDSPQSSTSTPFRIPLLTQVFHTFRYTISEIWIFSGISNSKLFKFNNLIIQYRLWLTFHTQVAYNTSNMKVKQSRHALRVPPRLGESDLTTVARLEIKSSNYWSTIRNSALILLLDYSWLI